MIVETTKRTPNIKRVIIMPNIVIIKQEDGTLAIYLKIREESE